MAGREWRRGTAYILRLQTRELKSTHEVKMLFDLLPPCDPQVPAEVKWMMVTFFLALPENQAGRVVFSGRQTAWSCARTSVKTNGQRQKIAKRHIVPKIVNCTGECLGVKRTLNLWICFLFLPRKFPLLHSFPHAVSYCYKIFSETLLCNQSAHSDSYNYSTSSVQLTAPEQSSSENGTHFYFDNGCRGVQLIVRS